MYTGFGYQWPSDDYSRLANIFVMIFGTCIVFAAISNVMVNRLSDLQQKRKYTDFDRMEEIYANRQRRIAMNVVASIGILLAAGLVFWWLEDWTFITGVYFAAQIATVSAYTLHLSPVECNDVYGALMLQPMLHHRVSASESFQLPPAMALG
jgi:MFS family permease